VVFCNVCEAESFSRDFGCSGEFDGGVAGVCPVLADHAGILRS